MLATFVPSSPAGRALTYLRFTFSGQRGRRSATDAWGGSDLSAAEPEPSLNDEAYNWHCSGFDVGIEWSPRQLSMAITAWSKLSGVCLERFLSMRMTCHHCWFVRSCELLYGSMSWPEHDAIARLIHAGT